MLMEDILRVVLPRVTLNTVHRQALQLVDYVVTALLQCATANGIPGRHHIVKVDAIDGESGTESAPDSGSLTSLVSHELSHAHLVVAITGFGSLGQATRLVL